MTSTYIAGSINYWLVIGASLSAMASLLHIGCIKFGAPWYRFFGAGEEMAKMAEQGSLKPAVMTGFITLVLAVWALYGLSGAGVIEKLPLLKLSLCVITAIYIVRGAGGFILIWKPLGRSKTFWFVSSMVCLGIGLIHLTGLLQVWTAL